MKHTTRNAVQMTAVIVLLFVGHPATVWAGGTTTAVCGVLSANTTWSLTKSPYDICAGGFTVLSGATLTVDPGVTVQFEAGSGSKLYIQGGLIARGSATQPIKFTGIAATPGSWGGLSADGTAAASSSVSLDYVTLEYGGITLSQRRWFAPADGTTKIYFDISLKDGNGAAIPGRKVKLSSSLGSVTDGGITDANGKTLAYLTSKSAGDADVSATLDATSACEGALSPDAKVTFTTPLDITDLLPNAPASYFDGDLKVSPLPVVTGVPTTVTAVLANPLATSVTVDVTFGFAQAGIGLVFGPLKDFAGQVIPGNSSITLSATWVPTVSGHYCVQASYAITAVGTAAVPAQMDGGRTLKQFNLNAYQAPTGSPAKGGGLDKTRNSLKQVNRFVNRAYDTNPIAIPLAIANEGISWDLNNAEKISNALQGDPPRQDYTVIATPHNLSLPPVQAGKGISAARAAALNELDDALAQANADIQPEKEGLVRPS